MTSPEDRLKISRLQDEVASLVVENQNQFRALKIARLEIDKLGSGPETTVRLFARSIVALGGPEREYAVEHWGILAEHLAALLQKREEEAAS